METVVLMTDCEIAGGEDGHNLLSIVFVVYSSGSWTFNV